MMAITTAPDNESVDYRYFVCDLMTNELLAEVPFRDVSYSRSLTEAGSFNGDIAITPDTYNLSIYENTLPAKTALYVTRNDVCVWGGIIWGRTYSLVEKVLSVTASEFTSYLSHRVVWKTYNSSYEATVIVESGTATITLTGGQYGFSVGEQVFISWGPDYALYNGYFEVLTIGQTTDARSIITVPAKYVNASGADTTIPSLVVEEDEDGTADYITVETRQDTYNYALDLIRELNTDLFDFDFANNLIRPGIDLFNEIGSTSRSGNVATIVSTKKQELVPGQKVKVADVQSDIAFNNKEAIVKAIIDDYSFTYENPGADKANTGEVPNTYGISNYQRSANVATFETKTAHLLKEGDIILISNVSQTFDGYHLVYQTPASNFLFKAVMFGLNIGKSFTALNPVPTPAPSVKRIASVTYSTFGEFTTLGDIGFDFSANSTLSGNLEANPIIRGFELRTVAEVLEEYSTKPNGFEYRVDCEYDSTTNTFKKYFKFLPLTPASLKTWLSGQVDGYSGAIPASAYGADQRIFEFPGNVLEAQFEENAEDAATRFFVQGKDSNLGSAASQPYSAASNYKLLRQGWPVLDQVDDLDSEDENVLYKQAARLLEESVPPISTFSISVNGSAYPRVGDYNPGDWCSVKLNDDFVSLRADSYLEQDYGTDNGVLVRKIVAFTVGVPDSPGYPETVTLELVTEPSIPISGVTIVDGKPFNGN
jgi:hypothetical protein